MSATIIMFPARPGQLDHVACGDITMRGPARISATALEVKFVDHFLPVVQASADLLAADKQDFEDRCRRMLDADGAGIDMIDELCAEMELVGWQMQVLVNGLELTRGRLRTAVARLVNRDATQREEVN